MFSSLLPSPEFSPKKSRHPAQVAFLRRLDGMLVSCAFIAVIMRHGLNFGSNNPHSELALVAFAAMLFSGPVWPCDIVGAWRGRRSSPSTY